MIDEIEKEVITNTKSITCAVDSLPKAMSCLKSLEEKKKELGNIIGEIERSNIVTLVVSGSTKSGKSTVINSLLGEDYKEYLPVDFVSETYCPWEIEQSDGYSITINQMPQNTKFFNTLEEFLAEVNLYSRKKFCDYFKSRPHPSHIKLTVPIAQGEETKWKIIDTPGVNEVGMTDEVLKVLSSSITMVLYCINLNCGGGNLANDLGVLKNIALPHSRIIFVLTRYDEIIEKENPVQILKKFYKDIEDNYGIQSPCVLCSSSGVLSWKNGSKKQQLKYNRLEEETVALAMKQRNVLIQNIKSRFLTNVRPKRLLVAIEMVQHISSDMQYKIAEENEVIDKTLRTRLNEGIKIATEKLKQELDDFFLELKRFILGEVKEKGNYLKGREKWLVKSKYINALVKQVESIITDYVRNKITNLVENAQKDVLDVAKRLLELSKGTETMENKSSPPSWLEVAPVGIILATGISGFVGFAAAITETAMFGSALGSMAATGVGAGIAAVGAGVSVLITAAWSLSGAEDEVAECLYSHVKESEGKILEKFNGYLKKVESEFKDKILSLKKHKAKDKLAKALPQYNLFEDKNIELSGLIKPLCQMQNDLVINLKCPLDYEFMKEPVMLCDGNIYERSLIEQWLKDYDTSPITGNLLENKEFHPYQTETES